MIDTPAYYWNIWPDYRITDQTIGPGPDYDHLGCTVNYNPNNNYDYFKESFCSKLPLGDDLLPKVQANGRVGKCMVSKNSRQGLSTCTQVED